MKVTRGYIRKLVLEAMQELSFDIDYFAERVIEAVNDTDQTEHFKFNVNNKDDKDFFFINEVHTGKDDMRYAFSIETIYKDGSDTPTYKYTIERHIPWRMYDEFVSEEVKTQEDADNVIQLIHRVGNNDLKYFEELDKLISRDNEKRDDKKWK